MKPFLLLQHRYLDEASDNEYEAVLTYGNLQPNELVRVRMDQQSIADINPLNYSGIITGGGPANISDPEGEKSAIQKRFEFELAELYPTIFEHDIPYLGMCYGMGSISRFLDGEVGKDKFSEPVGAVTITKNPAVADPLLDGIPNTFTALAGHKESCQKLPEKATLLASSPDCPVQMIRCKRNIYATQFHPELDVSGITLRINVYKNHGYFKPEAAQDLIDSLQGVRVNYPPVILKNFVERFRG